MVLLLLPGLLDCLGPSADVGSAGCHPVSASASQAKC